MGSNDFAKMIGNNGVSIMYVSVISKPGVVDEDDDMDDTGEIELDLFLPFTVDVSTALVDPPLETNASLVTVFEVESYLTVVAIVDELIRTSG